MAHQIGLSTLPEPDVLGIGGGPVIAIIDSGVDYNHPVLLPAIWRNPNPTKDLLGKLDLVGWDFISNDRKPFDDHFHGTEVAGSILAVEPNVQLMILKVFNPWGVTNSSAMREAFRYALDHRAQMIVGAWAPALESQTLNEAIEATSRQDVLFVTELASQAPNVIQVSAVGASPIADLFVSLPKTAALQPRGETSTSSARHLAVGLVTGAAARMITQRQLSSGAQIKQTLLDEARSADGLKILQITR